MTERSRFWNGTTLGDASEAAYDAPTEFAQVLMALTGSEGLTDRGGVHVGAYQNLTPSVPGANTVRIAGGQAQVYGAWYQNDANLDINVPTPAGATRNDLVVLRKSWASQTVRLTRIAGAEGGGFPAISQVVGTTWDLPIVGVTITTGGVMTLTDQRHEFPDAGAIPVEEYRLANGATRRVFIDEAAFGGLLIVCNDDGRVGVFAVRGGIADAGLLLEFPASSFTATLGTASRVNVDWNTTEYQIQNNSGAERLFRVFLFRGF